MDRKRCYDYDLLQFRTFLKCLIGYNGLQVRKNNNNEIDWKEEQFGEKANLV